MKQKSLLSFFGKPKKKLKLNNDDEPISQQATTQEDDKINVGPTPSDHSQAAKDSSVLDVAAAEVVTDCIKSSSSSSENLGVANKDEVIVKTSFDEHNDTDTTQSKESNDSDSSSSSDDDEDNHVDNDKEVHYAPTSDITANPYQKSEYELLRERNIARNNARLKALGLMVGPSDTSANNRTKQRRRIKAAKVTNKPAVVEPARRSSRLSGIKMNYTDDSGQDRTPIQNKAVVDEEEIQEEEHFKVSPLFDYQMNDGCTSSTVFSEPDCQVSGDGKIKTLVPSGKRLVPPAGLSAIYSLQFFNSNETTSSSSTAAASSSPWLVGAGKSGLIAVWDCNSNASMTTQDDQIEYVEPVLSWKGHGGRWIADARFVPSLDSSNSRIPSRLVTAGNDGTVCHWDLSTTSLTTGAPRLLHQTKKTLHSSGIFSMDVKAQQQDCLIVTGSKDKSIAVSKLSQLANDEGPSWRSRFHTGKVACVSFSSSTINPLIASASDDGLVAIHDMRISSSDTVACLEDSHFRPHSAVWKPSSDSIFLTAGLDDVIKLWDLRKTGEPIMSMHGHVPTSGKRLKSIHRPTFLNKGSDSFILSGGENSHAISMFHVDEEKTNTRTELFSVTSRGKLPDGSGDVGSMAVHSNKQVAVTVEGGEVVILSPQP